MFTPRPPSSVSAASASVASSSAAHPAPPPPLTQARRPQPWKPSAVFEHLPPHPFAKISTEGIALGDVRALHALARQGSWRAVVGHGEASNETPVEGGLQM